MAAAAAGWRGGGAMAKRRGARSEIVVVRGQAKCRGTRVGELPRNALWRFAAAPALAFQRRLSSGRPSRHCAVKLPLPRLPPPPVATAATRALAFCRGPALAFQCRLSSGRPSRHCAVKLSLPRLPPPPVATVAPKAQVRRGSQPPRFNDGRLPTAPTPRRAATAAPRSAASTVPDAPSRRGVARSAAPPDPVGRGR